MHNHTRSTSPLDHWTCIICSKPISSSRPPTFNSSNCSCAEKGSFADGHAYIHDNLNTTTNTNTNISPYDQTSHYTLTSTPFHSQPTGPLGYTHVPESNDSSGSNITDVPYRVCPEGVEKEEPKLVSVAPSPSSLMTKILILAPELGSNEKQARRSFSFHNSDYPPQLQHYLNSRETYSYSHTTDHHDGSFSEYGNALHENILEPGNAFLDLGTWFNECATSMRVNECSTRRSGDGGVVSDGGLGGGERSWWNGLSGVAGGGGEGCGYGQVVGAGGWADEDGDFYEGGVGCELDLSWSGE